MDYQQPGQPYQQQPGYQSHPDQQYAHPQQPYQGETNIMAILGLVFAFVFPILGIIFSAIGLSKAKTMPPHASLHGVALAGLICSIIFTAITVIAFIAVIAAFPYKDFLNGIFTLLA